MKKETPEQTTVSGQKPLSLILDEIEERANKATGGPWAHCKGASVFAPAHRISKDAAVLLFVNDARSNSEADFDFVASARTDVPALVKALRELWDKYTDAVGRGTTEEYYLATVNDESANLAAILNQK